MHRKLISFWLFAALLTDSALAQENPPKSTLENARQALTTGKPGDAIALVDPIISKAETDEAKDPDAICPGVAVAILSAFMSRQDPSVVVSVEDDWCEAMLVKGYALAELKRFAEATVVLGKLVGHEPNNPNYLAEYAFALQASGQMDDSMKVYKKVVSVSGRQSDKPSRRHWRAVGLRGIGYIHSDRQEWDDAVKAYKASLKDDPGNKIALSELDYIEKSRPK